MKADTHDYDPRFDRAQTVAGAKARYVAPELPEYGEAMLEADLERLLEGGAWPDRDENMPDGIRHAAVKRPDELKREVKRSSRKPNLSQFGSNETWRV